MRHKYKGRKLGTDWSHTKAMKRSLVQALFLNDRIKTTEARAKEVRGDVDRIITWAKRGDLHSRRLAIAALGNDKELVREIFEKVNQGMFEGRPGGYTRIMKLGPRKGDGAPMVIMELVTETCVPKSERKDAKPKKATPKKVSKSAKKDAEKDVKEQEKANEEESPSLLEEVKENFEAAIEEESEAIHEAAEDQLADEKKQAAEDNAEAAKKAEHKEEVVEEKAKAEEERARQAEVKEMDDEDNPEMLQKD